MAKVKKLKYRCDNCNSSKVQAKAWVTLNTFEVDFSLSESGDEEDYWCDKCQAHTTVSIK